MSSKTKTNQTTSTTELTTGGQILLAGNITENSSALVPSLWNLPTSPSNTNTKTFYPTTTALPLNFQLLKLVPGHGNLLPRLSNDIWKQTNFFATHTNSSSHEIDTKHHKQIKRHDSIRVKEQCVIEEEEQQQFNVFHDLVAGGVAGSASVIAGHPFDTIKVRLQTSSTASFSTAFNGMSSLFRGMGAPLSTAAIVNALVFSSFGYSSRLWDDYYSNGVDWKNGRKMSEEEEATMDLEKSFICGSFAGFVQCLVICPMEHLKCRLQILQSKSSAKPAIKYRGPFHVMTHILSSHGLTGLYRGWVVTAWREVPAFGVYFATYDHIKERINSFFRSYDSTHSHSWAACAFAGGMSGSLTWVMIYPLDVIKTKIQTSDMHSTEKSDRKLWHVGKKIVRNHGWKALFRGLGVTLLRAFPVNGIIFPVYEFTLMQLVGEADE